MIDWNAFWIEFLRQLPAWTEVAAAVAIAYFAYTFALPQWRNQRRAERELVVLEDFYVKLNRRLTALARLLSVHSTDGYLVLAEERAPGKPAGEQFALAHEDSLQELGDAARDFGPAWALLQLWQVDGAIEPLLVEIDETQHEIKGLFKDVRRQLNEGAEGRSVAWAKWRSSFHATKVKSFRARLRAILGPPIREGAATLLSSRRVAFNASKPAAVAKNPES